MYEALVKQVEQSVELMEDLRPPAISSSILLASSQGNTISSSEFYGLIYNNLVQPNWGWSFEDFWTVVHWVLQNPEGGVRWGLEARTSIDLSEVHRRVRHIAQKWLVREEAACFDNLRHIVENVLQKTQVCLTL